MNGMGRAALALVVLLVAASTSVVLGAPGPAPTQLASQQRWVMTDLGTLPGRCCGRAVAINERGQVTGSIDLNTFENGDRAFLWEKGKLTNLGTLFPKAYEAASVALGINERGEIIGDSTPHHLSQISHGFVWAKGKMRKLGTGRVSAWTWFQEISSLPAAINDRGQVAGTHAVSAEHVHAVLWRNGRASDLGTLPRRPFSEAVAINERGWVAGISYAMTCCGPDGSWKHMSAFVWHDGKRVALGALPGATETWSGTEARAINNRGQIVGSSGNRAFLWQSGRMIDLGTLPGHAESRAAAINDRGQIIGNSGSSQGENRAFLWQNGRMTDLGTLGGTKSDAVAINERGQVIGSSTTASGATHAFVWQNGTMTDLGAIGGGESQATAINNRGQIVGSTQTAKGKRRPVLWTPS
jgi:probable HAF family extracellular repeat protein